MNRKYRWKNALHLATYNFKLTSSYQWVQLQHSAVQFKGKLILFAQFSRSFKINFSIHFFLFAQRSLDSVTFDPPNASFFMLKQLKWCQQWSRQPWTSTCTPNIATKTGRVYRCSKSGSDTRAWSSLGFIDISKLRRPDAAQWKLVVQKHRRVQ